MSNGAMTKVLHPGKAAQSGILSAYLVNEGFTGPDTVLEHKQGFYSGYADQFNPDRIIYSLPCIEGTRENYTLKKLPPYANTARKSH